jgi:hypothetical protein
MAGVNNYYCSLIENRGCLRSVSQCLVQKDGTVSEITIRMLRDCWGWDGQDPFWLAEPANLDGKEVEIVVEEESFIGRDGQERTAVKVRYINLVGGRRPEPADRKAVLAKYGAKFRALSGSGVEHQSNVVPQVTRDRSELQAVELGKQPVHLNPRGRDRGAVIHRVQRLKVVPDRRDGWGEGCRLRGPGGSGGSGLRGGRRRAEQASNGADHNTALRKVGCRRL